MFVGGEFYYDQFWHTGKPSLSSDGMVFFNGGKACLTVICTYLLEHGIRRILLPSYLCPSIVNTVEMCGMQYEFFRINRDLTIDNTDLAQKVASQQAVYCINYFGFNQPPAVRDLLRDLQHKGVFVIEDNAQAGFTSHPIGDFIFNSMRKLVPYDGGYLITNFDLKPTLDKIRDQPNHRLPVIQEYRKKLYAYLIEGIGNYDDLVRLFTLSEQFYTEDHVIFGNAQEKIQIEHLDWEGIKQVRRDNYQYLLDLIRNIPGITPIYPVLQDGVMPMGIPVYITGVSRNSVNEWLGEAGIGLVIHWDNLADDTRANHNPLAVEMANSMLTLTIDQRTTRGQLDYLAGELKKAVLAGKSGGAICETAEKKRLLTAPSAEE